jgi:hypothetical protein
LFKLFKRIFSSVVIFFYFLYLSTPVSAHRVPINDADGRRIGEIHCSNLCDPNLQLQINREDALQGDTNLCLATCMNIVHRDILNKGIPLRPPFHQEGSIADFAKLAFILCPVQNEEKFPFQLMRGDDVEAITYIRLFSTHLGYPSNEDGFYLEWRNFQRELKTYTVEKREEMWDGKNLFPALPNRLKQLLSIDDHSVPEIFNKIAIPQPSWLSFCRLISVEFDGVNHWDRIHQDIWDGERMVILNMGNIAGGIGHSVVAYAAARDNVNNNNMICIYDPDGGRKIIISTNSHHSISDYQISSYCIFNY